MQPAEVVAAEPLPRPRKRRTGVLIALSVVVVLAGAGVAGYALLKPDAHPRVVAAASPDASATDELGRSACKQVFTPEILAPDAARTMSERDWQVWARSVRRIADNAALSSNREVARAGEDLQFEMKGDTFIPAFVKEAAGRLRDACDRVDYINIPGR